MINWGLGTGNNALAMFQYGAQLGQNMQDRRDERQRQNALLDIRQREADAKTAEQEREARAREVQARAAQGDPSAMAELSGLDLAAWRGLAADQRSASNDRMKVLGNAALDVLNRPPEQRAAAWDAYVGQLSQQMPELARFAGQYSEQAARSVVAQAEMMGKLHELESPDYQAIPAGGTLVNTSDPSAVQEYMDGLGPPAPAGVTFTPIEGGPGGSPSGAGFPGR